MDHEDEPVASDGQTRREFCARTCAALALAAVGGGVAALLQGCGGGGPASPSGGSFDPLATVSGTAAGGTITVPIGAGSPLASVGGVALVRSSAGDVLVARTTQDGFAALSATCTHQGCEITGHSGQTFVCPCHGAQFDSSGRVTGGPARNALRQYATRFANDVLTISG